MSSRNGRHSVEMWSRRLDASALPDTRGDARRGATAFGSPGEAPGRRGCDRNRNVDRRPTIRSTTSPVLVSIVVDITSHARSVGLEFPMKTMKAAVVHDFGQAAADRGGAGPRRHGRGRCWSRSWPRASATPTCTPPTATGRSSRRLPFIPGHEGVGYVAARRLPASRQSRKATASACPGCTPPVATASTASPAGRPCATSSR